MTTQKPLPGQGPRSPALAPPLSGRYIIVMRHYPAFLDLRGQRCLIVGVGAVGRRKLATLLACGPEHILILDPRPLDDELRILLQAQPVTYETRSFSPEDLDGRFLVIASSADRELNARIGRLCRERGLLCNVVTEPEAGNFIVPAQTNLEGLTAAISTAGVSPDQVVTAVLERLP